MVIGGGWLGGRRLFATNRGFRSEIQGTVACGQGRGGQLRPTQNAKRKNTPRPPKKKQELGQ
jgi:hypothetical protein